MRCGACVAACPTNALLALPPLDDGGLFAQVDAAGTAARERADAGTAAAGTSNTVSYTHLILDYMQQYTS